MLKENELKVNQESISMQTRSRPGWKNHTSRILKLLVSLQTARCAKLIVFPTEQKNLQKEQKKKLLF